MRRFFTAGSCAWPRLSLCPSSSFWSSSRRLSTQRFVHGLIGTPAPALSGASGFALALGGAELSAARAPSRRFVHGLIGTPAPALSGASGFAQALGGAKLSAARALSWPREHEVARACRLCTAGGATPTFSNPGAASVGALAPLSSQCSHPATGSPAPCSLTVSASAPSVAVPAPRGSASPGSASDAFPQKGAATAA